MNSMSYWTTPPIEKVIEALGALADGRILMDGDTARVASSSRGKYYDITYDPITKAMMVNDNLSYYKGMLGYPGVAYLLMTGVLTYDPRVLPLVRDIPWKDLNTKFKGNFRKTLETVLEKLSAEEGDFLQDEAGRIYEDLKKLQVPVLGERVKPPEGY